MFSIAEVSRSQPTLWARQQWERATLETRGRLCLTPSTSALRTRSRRSTMPGRKKVMGRWYWDPIVMLTPLGLSSLSTTGKLWDRWSCYNCLVIKIRAGVMGYTETRERQDNYLQIRPASSKTSSTSATSTNISSGRGSGSGRFGSSSSGGAQQLTTTLTNCRSGGSNC